MVERLVPLFEEAGVRLVLSGHEHNFQHSVVNGIHYVVSRAAGKLGTEPPTDCAGAMTRAWANEGHFLVVELDEDRVVIHPVRDAHVEGSLGGLLGAQPLGRVLSAGRALHGAGEGSRGVHVLIDPRSENASLEKWSDPDAHPSWQTGASRALAILSEQSLFDDMRRIEKDYSRLEWAERLADRLAGYLDEGAASSLREFISRWRS